VARSGSADRIEAGGVDHEPAVELVEPGQLLLEAKEHLLVALDRGRVGAVAFEHTLAVVAELGLGHLDVVGDTVDANHQRRRDGLRGELAELLHEVRPVLELLGERQDGLDLGVVPGGVAEALDGVVDALGHPLAVGVAEGTVDQAQRDRDEQEGDGDDVQEEVGVVHSRTFLVRVHSRISRVAYQSITSSRNCQ